MNLESLKETLTKENIKKELRDFKNSLGYYGLVGVAVGTLCIILITPAVVIFDASKQLYKIVSSEISKIH